MDLSDAFLSALVKKFPLFLLPFRLMFPELFAVVSTLSLELLLVREDD